MRILYVITRSELGGAQAVVLTYLQALGTHADIALATGEEGFLADQARALGVPVFILPDLVPQIAPASDCRTAWSLYKLIRQCQPDLVHAHSSKAGLLGRLAARLAGIPSVFTAHGFAFTENASFRRKADSDSEQVARRQVRPNTHCRIGVRRCIGSSVSDSFKEPGERGSQRSS